MECFYQYCPPRKQTILIIRISTSVHRQHCIHPNHSITTWSRLAGTSGGQLVQPPARAGPPRAPCPGPCPGGFRRSTRREIHHLSGQPEPALGHPHNKNVSPDVQEWDFGAVFAGGLGRRGVRVLQQISSGARREATASPCWSGLRAGSRGEEAGL